jgi:hypothetical protein
MMSGLTNGIAQLLSHFRSDGVLAIWSTQNDVNAMAVTLSLNTNVAHDVLTLNDFTFDDDFPFG